MATRSVSLYLGLERSLADAISAGDREAASALLADGFEFRSGKSKPTRRKQWLDRELAAKRPAALVRDLNVSETAGGATATFLLDYRGEGGAKGPVFLVTDAWDSATRRLQRRQAVEMKSPPPPFDRPTGRE
jgi:hypothetical protein